MIAVSDVCCLLHHSKSLTVHQNILCQSPEPIDCCVCCADLPETSSRVSHMIRNYVSQGYCQVWLGGWRTEGPIDARWGYIGCVACGETKISLHSVVQLCTEGNHISGTMWAWSWYGSVHGASIILFAIDDFRVGHHGVSCKNIGSPPYLELRKPDVLEDTIGRYLSSYPETTARLKD